jgi:hypothetical protein
MIEGEKILGITERDLKMIQDLFQEEIFSMQQELHKQREDFKQLRDLKIKSTSFGHDNSIRKMIASFRSEAGSAEVLTIPANRLVNMLEELYSTVEDPDISSDSHLNSKEVFSKSGFDYFCVQNTLFQKPLFLKKNQLVQKN